MRKNIFKFALLATVITTVCLAQQGSVQQEGGRWTNTVNGSFSGVRNLRVKVEVGAVRVQGGSSQGITYVIRTDPTSLLKTGRAGNSRSTRSARIPRAILPGSWASGKAAINTDFLRK